MRLVLQRVTRASVSVEGGLVGSINDGLLILAGFAPTDNESTVELLAKKVVHLRIFSDEAGKMNLSILDIGGSILVVSQFTLYGETRKGNRPSFVGAASPELAERLYDMLVAKLKVLLGADKVQQGQFRANMEVELVNSGPVTILIDSAREEP
jgi:D-aminoacyl-tRNA deacylase